MVLFFVGYDEEVLRVMEYVFGNMFICVDVEIVKKVIFDFNVRMCSIIFEGDVYDFLGIFFGGSVFNFSGVLVIL